jgi:hypothetical protein
MQDNKRRAACVREGLLLVTTGSLHLACVVLGLAMWGDVAFFTVGGTQTSVGFPRSTEVALELLTAS